MSTIVQLVIVPDTITLDPGQQVNFAAYGRLGSGDSARAVVTWTATGGAISAAGTYTADTVAGSFAATATVSSLGLSHSSTIHNRGRRRTASVVVTPATASVAVGSGTQLSATPKDSSGTPVTGRVATWTSTDSTTATVNGSGSVHGVRAGATTIIATIDGFSGTANVTVTSTTTSRTASVVVTPATASIAVGSGTQLTATPKDSAGNPLSGRPVIWRSTDSTTASVNGSGLVQGVRAGTATVIATIDGFSGAASVTVTATTTSRTASVVVTPATASVAVGSVAQLTATPKDSAGNPVPGRPVTWRSSDSTIATVSGTGLVQGVRAGTVTITATIDAHSGTAGVTVTSTTTSATCANPQPGWIWCDDFEQNRLSSYFEVDDGGGSFTRVAGAGRNGSTGMQATYAAGQVSNGSLHLAFGKTPQSYMRPVDAGTALYTDVYWRFYVKYQAGWTGGMGGKMTRTLGFVSASSFNSFNYGQSYELSDGQLTLSIDPASGTDAAGNLVTTGYNDFAHMRYLGETLGTTPIFDASHVGQWYCLEYHVKLNTPGQSDGMFEVWINGASEISRTGLNWRGTYEAWGINAIYLENYWNSGSPQQQSRYFDDFIVSTQRVGC
ncbi:MAG TPA: Ig-like domain-containing protein [Solirubrobacteraceae bacterium]|nr:Ig-like domain-containing protein [Solirubrobacteraceae bacterium]